MANQPSTIILIPRNQTDDIADCLNIFSPNPKSLQTQAANVILTSTHRKAPTLYTAPEIRRRSWTVIPKFWVQLQARSIWKDIERIESLRGIIISPAITDQLIRYRRDHGPSFNLIDLKHLPYPRAVLKCVSFVIEDGNVEGPATAEACWTDRYINVLGHSGIRIWRIQGDYLYETDDDD